MFSPSLEKTLIFAAPFTSGNIICQALTCITAHIIYCAINGKFDTQNVLSFLEYKD